MRRAVLGIAFSLYSTVLQAQWIDHKAAGIPRNADGKPNLNAPAPKTTDAKPDLSGLWLLPSGAGGIRQLKPTEISSSATALVKQRQENLGSDSPGVQCLPSGFIAAGGPGAMIKIVQTPGLILMLAEDLEYRQIFLDGRELPNDPNPAWMGYSVGHWEGETLVVESTGYNERSWLEAGYPHSQNLRLTERIRRTNFGHLAIDMTWSDPEIYAKPWTSKVEGILTPDTDLLEYVCAENERDRPHLVGKASDDVQRAITLAPEILSRYVGTYLFHGKDFGIPTIDIAPLPITLDEGVLQLAFAGTKLPMTPLSETKFTVSAIGEVEFGRDDKDQAYMIVYSVGGEFRGNRGVAPSGQPRVTGPPRITVFDRTGKVLSTLGEDGSYTQPAISPDGTRVAAIRTESATGDKNVWVFDIASGKGAAFTSGTTPKAAPVWSADGKEIAYTADLGNRTFAIYRKSLNGSPVEELIYTHQPGAGLIMTDWSADGRICFWSGNLMLALSVNGDRQPIELFHETYNVRGGRFSPDGRFIGYNSDESGKFQAFVGRLNPVAKGQQISKDPAAGGIFWREDGKELLFLSLPPEPAVMAVDISTSPTFRAGEPHVLFKLPSAIAGPAQLSSVASRDGQKFVFISQTPPTQPVP
jgi:Tol biopolymer transport system component